MQDSHSSVLTRDDTFFGVCEALGEDFGFHPNLLRLGFALTLFFSPLAAVGGYAAAGLVVAATRWFVPNPRVAVPAVERDEPATAAAENQMELALAA